MSDARAGAALFPPVHPARAWPAQPAGEPTAAAATHAAFRQAFAQGRAQGLKEGLAQGRVQGLAQGHAQGHALGLEEGRSQGREQALQDQQAQAERQAGAHLRARADELLALARSLPLALAQAEEALAQDLMDLALTLAQQVLGQALAADPALMLGTVRDLMQAEPALTGRPQLLLHPDDLPLVNEHLAEDLQAAGWRLKADATLERGGCRVLAASGELDARLGARWQRVAAALACQPVVAHVAPNLEAP